MSIIDTKAVVVGIKRMLKIINTFNVFSNINTIEFLLCIIDIIKKYIENTDEVSINISYSIGFKLEIGIRIYENLCEKLVSGKKITKVSTANNKDFKKFLSFFNVITSYWIIVLCDT